MTDAEILEKLREYFQTKVNNLSGDEMAEGPFEDPDETPETYGDRWEAAAKVIGQRGGLRIRFEFGDTEIEWGYRYRGEPDHFMRIVSSEETARDYVGGREGWEICKRVPAGPWERAVAEARPHDDEACIEQRIRAALEEMADVSADGQNHREEQYGGDAAKHRAYARGISYAINRIEDALPGEVARG